MGSARLSVRVDAKIRRKLDALVRTSGRSESEVVRLALESLTVHEPAALSCYDVALAAGLIGAAKRLPRDLSTNPKHMEGMGADV